jgi:uncharacterized protein YdeI (YjbR/CyaY-like superfamily)
VQNIEIGPKLVVSSREEWREWLEKHHDTEKSVWLIQFRKVTGRKGLSYDDAVEEAICFGWIDSFMKNIDTDRYAQKFTPRQTGSKWSPTNLKRAAEMMQQGKMTPAGLRKLPADWEYIEAIKDIEK